MLSTHCLLAEQLLFWYSHCMVYRIVQIILLVACLLGVIVFPFGNIVYAQLPGFGGITFMAIPCTGNYPPAYLVYAYPADPSFPITYMVLLPGTILYSYYLAFIVPGSSLLGTYVPGTMPCLVGVCPYCYVYGTGSYVYQLGSADP